MSVTEWVKSTDRLPEVFDRGLSVMSSDSVLLYFDEEMKIARFCLGKYSDSKSYWSSNGYIIPIEDTYWMPLPIKTWRI
jgi:hypothetical protein